jgi:glycosyltransferase involved in cell wall biosynthesis
MLPTVTVVGRAIHAPWNEGTRVIARNTSLALWSAGYDTRTISLSEAAYVQQDNAEGAPVQHIASRVPHACVRDYWHLRDLARAIEASCPHAAPCVLHLIGAPWALGPLVHRPQRRIVAHITLSKQAYNPATERVRAVAAWRLFDRWIAAYACTSEQIRTDLTRRGVNREKLHVVPPPVDVQRFCRTERANARSALGWDPGAFVVLYVGTVSPLRFPASLVMKAVSLATAHIPHAVVEIFAPVATHGYNVAWAEENVGQAARGATCPVHVHLQDLADGHKAALYNAADVVLLPFNAPVAVEPPLTLLEAMACEATVAVAPYANRSHVVEDGMTGTTFTSVDELAARLTHLYGVGPEGRAALGAAARARVVQHYSFGAASRAIEGLWRAIGLCETAGPMAPTSAVSKAS